MIRSFLLRTLLVAMSLMSSVMVVAATKTATKPDFAYPQTVAKNSQKAFDVAVKSGNDIQAIRAVIDYALAQTNIGSENAPQAIEFVKSARTKMTSPASKALLDILLADIYNMVFDADSYKYNSRNLPLLPLPNDITEWSGDQFRHEITRLCSQALGESEALKKQNLVDYASIIECDKASRVYFPTLYDFVAHKSIDMLSICGNTFSTVGIIALAPRSVFIINPPIAPGSEASQKILEIYAELLKFHKDNPAPEIYCDINRIRFANDNLYTSIVLESSDVATKLLQELYKEYSSTEYSGDILITLNDFLGNDDSKPEKEYYSQLKDFKSRYPNFARIGCISNIINPLSQKSIKIDFPEMVAPENQFEVTVTSHNVPKATIKVFKLNGNSMLLRDIRGTKLLKLNPIQEIPVDFNGEIPYAANKTLQLSLPTFGQYVVAITAPDIPIKADNGYNTIKCTRLSAGRITDPSIDSNHLQAFVIDPLTGAPVGDASILYQKKYNGDFKELGETGTDGFYSFNLDQNSGGSFRPVKGNDKFAQENSAYYYVDQNNDDWNCNANIFTDLAIYHPGDSVRWCAAVYETKNFERRLKTETEFEAILFNAIYEPIDTIKVKSDNWGRINGAFPLPKGELTGNYHIGINLAGKSNIGNENFKVSDYKMPTYAITLDPAASGVPSTGDVTISGTVKTYSGVNLGGIPVKAIISASPSLWWYRNYEAFCTLADTTDASGKFSVVLTKEMIANSPAPNGLFVANVSATSLSGESQQASCNFTVGSRYTLVSNLPDIIEVSKPLDLQKYVKVEDSENKKVQTTINYTISATPNDETIASGTVDSYVNWQNIKGGTYTLKLFTPELKTDTFTVDNLVLYRADDNYSPVSETIWSPENNLTISKGNETSALIFAAEDDTHALIFITANGKIIERRWEKLRKGHNQVKFTIPADINEASVKAGATKNYKAANCNFAITRTSTPSLTLHIESFRDRLISGSEETWTIRATNQDSTGVSAALFADLYNKALDALTNHNWNLSFNSWGPQPSISFPMSSRQWNNSGQSSFMRDKCSDIIEPNFDTYGLSFSPVSRRMTVVTAFGFKSRSNSIAVMEDAALSLDEVAVAGYGAAPRAAEYKSAKKETGTIETVEEAAADAGAQPEAKEFEYRDNETALAFFHPTLNTDANGNLRFSFTLPNQNTTWALNMVGYDKNLSTASLRKEITASKPLMVQPNLPRFLRSGDKALISATVMNNTDTATTATVDIEIFTPSDMKIIGNHTSELALEPNASKQVDIELSAPLDAAFIGYRIKASNAVFADGEQSVIPILPATSPVIESKPFYLDPDSTEFSMTIPDYPADSRITLRYCDNPTWYVATAISGLSAKESRTAPQAAAAIFSASVADGILKSLPQVESALKSWSTSNRSDSVLVSMLQRNSDLKTFLLQATPWMQNAQSDSERMERLALLFDRSNISAAIAKNIALLKQLQCDDGGWAWMSSYKKSSEWATYRTLYILGKINRLGFLPGDKNLKTMVENALAYQQKLTEKDFKKYPKSDYTSFAVLRDLWPSVKPSATGTRIINATVQKQIAGWKKMTVPGKAIAAMLLANHGYKRIATQVLASLTQYAKTSPTQGMYWPILSDFAGGSMTELTITANILEAYHAISPNDAAIDRIRQWLILQKETRDWGDDMLATEVAAAVLLTSPKWIEPAQKATVMIGNRPVNVNKTEATLGEFTANISSLAPTGKTLSINRTGTTPAWGAVTSQFISPMTDVKAASCDAVSIEKRFYRQVGNKWIEANEIKVGDRVKIELLLHVNSAMDYVAISDERAACLEPVEQLPTPIFSEGLCFYRENRDAATNIFISSLPRGTYLLSYEMWVNNAGTFASGIATIQSQYAPVMTAHSSGRILTASPN